MGDVRGEFSRGGSRYCALGGGGGGRARVWGEKGGAPDHEITPEAHLAAPLSCFVWLRLRKQEDRKWKNRKRKCPPVDEEDDGDGESTHLAFGTTVGKILVYSLAEAKFETALEDGTPGAGDPRISCLDWTPRLGLHSCSPDSVLRRWSLADNELLDKSALSPADGDPSPTTAIRLVPHLKNGRYNKHRLMLTASHRLRLWCLNSMTVLRTMIGHANEVCLLDVVCFPNESKLYAVSGSKNDRIISFWSLNVTEDELSSSMNGKDSESSDGAKQRRRNSKSKSKSQAKEIIDSPNCNFLMEDVARMVSCSTAGANQNTVKICTVTRSGSVHYYEHTLNGLLSKPLKPNTTLQIASQETDGAVKPSHIICAALNKEGAMRIGYSLGLGMIFEQVVPNLSEKIQVLIKDSTESGKSAKKSNKHLAESATKIKLADSKDSSVVFLSSTMSHGDKKNLKRAIGMKQGDVPMESRLANLTITQPGNKSVDLNNLAQLLVQALHSKDEKLLQTVFECKDPEVAYNTLNRIPIQYVSPLLDHLIGMFQGKTNQCQSACVWSEALCKAKSSTLLALSSSGNEKVKQLCGVLTARLPCLSDLLALRGRLSLALHKVKENSNAPIVQAPLLEFKDSSSDDDDDEDMDNMVIQNSENDHESWNEDDDDDDNEDDDDDEEKNSSRDSDDNLSGKEMDTSEDE